MAERSGEQWAELERRGNELSARAYALEDRGSVVRSLWCTGRTIRLVSRLAEERPEAPSCLHVLAAHLYRRSTMLPSFLGLRSARRSADVYERLARLKPEHQRLHADTRAYYARRAARTGRLGAARTAADAALAASLARRDEPVWRRRTDHAVVLFGCAEVRFLSGDREGAEEVLAEAVTLFRKHRRPAEDGGPYGPLHPRSLLARAADSGGGELPFTGSVLARAARALRAASPRRGR